MSVSSLVQSRVPGKPDDLIWRLTVDQYHEMTRMGILTSDDPVELLEGWLVSKMPKSPRHRIVTHVAREQLGSVVPPGWYVDSQEPITLDDSEPEPDVVVVRGKTEDYRDSHPGPAHVALVVEVSDSTLERDRALKKRVYARAGIPAYWILNVVEKLVEVYTDPSGPSEAPAYRKTRKYAPGDEVPLIIEGREIGRMIVSQLLALNE